MTRINLTLFSIVIGSIGLALIVWWDWPDSSRTAPTAQIIPSYGIRTDDPDILAMGANVYEIACASCHGLNLEGQENWRMRSDDGFLPAPPHDQDGHTWHHPDFILFNVVKFGPGYNVEGYRSKMRGYDGILSDAEIRAVNSYIAAQWPDNILKRQRAINADWEQANKVRNP